MENTSEKYKHLQVEWEPLADYRATPPKIVGYRPIIKNTRVQTSPVNGSEYAAVHTGDQYTIKEYKDLGEKDIRKISDELMKEYIEIRNKRKIFPYKDLGNS